MKLVFRDQAFSFELLRAIGYTAYDGADIGECLATAARIKKGDARALVYGVDQDSTAGAEDCGGLPGS